MRDLQAAHTFEQLLDAERDPSALPHEPERDLQERLAVARRLLAFRFDEGQTARDAVLRIGATRDAQPVSASETVRRSRRLLPALAVVTAALMLVLVLPGPRGVVARPIFQLLEIFNIGPHTEAVRAVPWTPEEEREALRRHQTALDTGRSWHIQTRYGAFGGSVPPGRPAIVQSTTSLRDLLQSDVDDAHVPQRNAQGSADRLQPGRCRAHRNGAGVFRVGSERTPAHAVDGPARVEGGLPKVRRPPGD